MRHTVWRLGALVLSAWLLSAAPASAAQRSSNLSLTAPSASPYLIDNQVTGNEQLSVGGTTTGLAGSNVDIKCYAGSGAQPLVSSVHVAADGTFQYTGSFRGISRQTCVLRAVPAGDATDYAPGSPSPYAGPLLNIGQATQQTVPSGPNAGKTEYYYMYVSQPAGAFEYASLGGCSISESYSYDATKFGGVSQAASEALDYCNAWFSWKNGYTGTPGLATPSRSEFQVDGVDAYLAGNAWSLNGMNTANNDGFPLMTYSPPKVDPATGDLELEETDQVVRCSPGGVYPPDAAHCSSFAPTGVQVSMHIVQNQQGRVATVVQSFSSIDGAAHRLDLLENNDFFHRSGDGELDFPWTGAGMQPYMTVGQVLAGPSVSGPGAFFIKGSAATSDGSEFSPQGQVTFSNAPTSETIVGTTNNSQHFSWVELHYSLLVPPAGEVPLAFTYSNGYSAGQVSADAAAAEAAFRPTISIGAPQRGIDTSARVVNVSGTASDATGLKSVSVDGIAAGVGAGGTWTVPVSLKPGANTITAQATNVFGNTAQAQETVVYVPTPVLSALHQAHRRWREPARFGKRRGAVGTTFGYTLNEPAQVRLLFTQQVPGRRAGGVCVAPSRRNRGHARCERTIARGSYVAAGRAGPNRWRFGGVMPDGRQRAPGSYTVTIVATTPSTGAQSGPVRLRFTILP